MSDDLAFLTARIPSYADYPDEGARHLVDKQVRAYVGEALAALGERLRAQLPAESAAKLDATLLRCEFSDQRAVRGLEHADLGGTALDSIHVVDRAIVTTADRAPSIDAAGLDAYLGELDDLLDRRARTIASVAPAKSYR